MILKSPYRKLKILFMILMIISGLLFVQPLMTNPDSTLLIAERNPPDELPKSAFKKEKIQSKTDTMKMIKKQLKILDSCTKVQNEELKIIKQELEKYKKKKDDDN